MTREADAPWSLDEPTRSKLAPLEALLREVGHRLARVAVTGLTQKGPFDVVSELDVWAEARISEYLRDAFPGDGILGEESASSVAYQSRLWVLDPLDGTVNRTTDVPFFGVSLALFVEGQPAAGWVFDPTHDELFAAVRGQGAFLNGETLRVASQGVRGLAMTSSVVRGLAAADPRKLDEVLASQGRLRCLGAQALHLAYVAAGRLAAAVSADTKLWDDAAGALLVQEAGGVYLTLDGADPFPLGPDDPVLQGAPRGSLAASPEAARRLLPYTSLLV